MRIGLAPVVVLLLAAGAVMAGVVGLAAVILPGATAAGVEATVATTILSGEGSGDPVDAAIVPPTEPPRLPGAVLQLTGDRDQLLDLNPPPGTPTTGELSEDSRFAIEANGDSLIFASDPESGLFLDQANLAGLNLFLDPEDCSFEELASSEVTGTAVLTIACPGVSDPQGANTISIDGYVAVPLNLTTVYETGGRALVGGDIIAELTWSSAIWYVQEEQDATTHEVANVINAIEVADYDAAGVPTSALVFGVDDDGAPFVHEVWMEDRELLAIAPGDCPVTVTPLARIAPNSEYLELAISCAGVGSEDRTIDLDGTIRIQRVTQTFTFFNN